MFLLWGEHRIQNCPKRHPPPNHYGKKFDQYQKKNVNAIEFPADQSALINEVVAEPEDNDEDFPDFNDVNVIQDLN